jgi:hypothetical protein
VYLRLLTVISAVLFLRSASMADEVFYGYEGDALPYDESDDWIVVDPCEPPCTESVEGGHLVLRWGEPADFVNYHRTFARVPLPPPEPFWVEWRFASNHPIGPYFYTCDGWFMVNYGNIQDSVLMYGDTAVSFSGDDFISGLAVAELHTYRFATFDGQHYAISVDGMVFIENHDDTPHTSYAIAMRGGGGCEAFYNTVNEWDYIRYGTISYGEQIVASDPPPGFVDARLHAGLDRFTVTFDEPNYVYVDEISVEVSGGATPEVIQTRRQDNGPPDTVEIVLDRPVPMGETTTLTFDDGVATNVVIYTFAPGDTNGDGSVNLADVAAFQCCFGQADPAGACLALDLVRDNAIDLGDFPELGTLLTGP